MVSTQKHFWENKWHNKTDLLCKEKQQLYHFYILETTSLAPSRLCTNDASSTSTGKEKANTENIWMVICGEKIKLVAQINKQNNLQYTYIQNTENIWMVICGEKIKLVPQINKQNNPQYTYIHSATHPSRIKHIFL